MKALQSNISSSLFILITLFSCNPQSEENAGEANEMVKQISVTKNQFKSAGIKLGTLSEQLLTTTISTRGYIDVPPGNKAAVSPFYGGYIKEIGVLPGQEVKKGELLFTLQNPDYLRLQQSYLEAMEQLDYLKVDFERQQTLAEEKIASQKNFNKAASDYRVMLAKYRGLKEQLRLMNVSITQLEIGKLVNTVPIYAPIGGFITKVNAVRSAYINATDVAVEIVNTDHIHLELQVFEKDAIHIKEDQKINFSIPESGTQVFAGEVHLVGKSVDSEMRTIDVHGHISDEDKARFIPGMYVQADIETSRVSATCLPASAIVEVDGETVVAIKTREDSATIFFEPVKVALGRRNEDWVEVLNIQDLQGKQVLVDGAFEVIR